MQRYSINLKSGTYTQGNMYTVQPVYRQQVVPGQTVDLDIQMSGKSAAFTQNISTPTMISMWFFYVPHRLVWDDWTAFISKEEGAPSFPTTTTYGSQFFEIDGNSQGWGVSPLYRRAYKACYNEYFGTETVGSAYSAWYDDITTDTNVFTYLARNPEQFASRMVLDGTVSDPEFSVTASSIPLNDFYRQMMNARSQQRSQMTGNKYVDTLARMGVDATWMIAERPEFLGTKSTLVAPHLTANTSDSNTGEEVARFETKCSLQIKGKHFAEHGYIVGVASMRPLLMFEGRGAQDMYETGGTWIDTFYSADNLDTKDKVYDNNNSNIADPTNIWSQRFAYLKNGTWVSGSGSSWIIDPTETSFERLIYPNTGTLPISNELGGDQVAWTTEVTLKGKTPIPTRVA